jgi:hypothetical protein
MKLTLTQITRTPRTSKDGKPFTSVSIKAKEYGEKFLSGFGNKSNEGWTVGQEVEVATVVEKPGTNKQGQPVVYLNFEMPKTQNGSNDPRIAEILQGVKFLVLANETLNKKLDAIGNHLSGKSLIKQPVQVSAKVSGTEMDYPVMDKEPNFDDIDPNSIPF